MSDLFNNTLAAGTGPNAFRASPDFPNPWLDYASTQMPATNEAVLKWCEYIWNSNGTYKIACERIISYFLTTLEFEEASGNEKEQYEEFLTYTLNIIPTLANIGYDFMCYGNSFTSLYIPFRRYLRCPKCKNETYLENIEYDFKDYEFHGACPNKNCKHSGKFIRIDRKSKEKSKIKVIRWSPHEIKLVHNPISDETIYLWDIPGTFKKRIKDGDKIFLNTTPWEIIECIKNNRPLEFNSNVLYHMKEPAPAGINSGGWGISRLLPNFRQAYYIQILKRYNEAIALDYIMPFRVITPSAGNSRSADPLVHLNLGDFSNNIQQMLARHRKDPATWHTLPFPINYQALTNADMAMIPQELLGAGIDELLNAIGIPVEFYKGSLGVQTAPAALRLFQQTWTNLVASLNSWLDWLLTQISLVFHWEKVQCRLTPSTLADDLEKRAILLQLSAGDQISKETAFKSLGIDMREEIRRIFEERSVMTEEQQKFEKQQAQKAQLEQTLEGGGPNQPPPQSPADVLSKAQEIAQQILQMPEGQRRSALNDIKKSNETLYAAVKSKMQDIRSEARSQGGAQVMAQNFGGPS